MPSNSVCLSPTAEVGPGVIYPPRKRELQPKRAPTSGFHQNRIFVKQQLSSQNRCLVFESNYLEAGIPKRKSYGLKKTPKAAMISTLGAKVITNIVTNYMFPSKGIVFLKRRKISPTQSLSFQKNQSTNQ